MNKKILLIDDDTYTRDVYEEVLQEAGFTVATAVNGQEGLQKIKEGDFDVILLDVMMPKLDGLGVLKELQTSSSKSSHCPIIMLTNLSQDPIIDEALKLGATSYITKSDINPDQLVSEVEKFLN